MGAGCSGAKAAEVQNSVNKITINAEAKEHLKQLGQNSNLSKEKINKLMKKGDEEDPDGGVENGVKDLDPLVQNKVARKNQQLWEAVETNDIKMVESILTNMDGNSGDQQLCENDLYDEQGQSMIHKAASLGHAEILMLLLERTGAKPDLVNAQLASPLHLACKNNRESVAKFLIGCGVDVNGQDEHGQTPLLICCIHGHHDLAALIVESAIAGHTPEPLEIDQKDHRGLTPLNCAAIKGDMKLVRLLIERGGASIEEASPKGCTPLIYSARGGYHEVVRYLLEKGASPLKQDNSGGTVLHHTIEKAHTNVLQVLIEHGIDVHSAIEIADNAGRTAIFEAVDNNVNGEILKMLVRKRTKGGLQAKVNVINYNGQTPLFSAVREGNMENIRILVEEGAAQIDLTGGELAAKAQDDEDQQQEEQYDSTEEKYFMEAYKNASIPLHLACILGHDHILHYLLDRGSNPNLQTQMKGYAGLHLAVLANKPEIVIELLTRSTANPHLPDYSGRTLIDMVEMFIPDYLESFNTLLENLHIERIKKAGGDAAEGQVVAVHYYNPDDEREIKGVKDQENVHEIYSQPQNDESPGKANINQLETEAEESKGNPQKRFIEMEDSEIEVEEGKNYEREIESVFGRKIALGLMAVNWKFKEMALKIIYKQTEKFLTKEGQDQMSPLTEFVRACTIAIDMTCKEKVIKVLNLSLQLLNLLISSQKLEQSQQSLEAFKTLFLERNIVLKLLQKSEEGNTRMTNKIHECLLDFSFHPKIGEGSVSSFILQRIQAHNKAALKTTDKDQTDKNNEIALGSYKGLLAQLALLYKFVNSFGVSNKRRGPLTVKDIVNAIVPGLTHSSQDVRNASTKILLDVQRLSGAVTDNMLVALTNEKVKQALMEKISQVQVEKKPKNPKEDDFNNEDSLYEYSQDENDLSSSSKLNESHIVKRLNTEEIVNEANEKIMEKAQSKDWNDREMALKHMKETFENNSRKQLFQEEFLTNCLVLLKSCLEDNNLSLYLVAVEVAALFFSKALYTETVLGSLQSLIKAVVVKSTDTNTRVRKKSVDLINQIWNQQPPAPLSKNKDQSQLDQTQKDSISSLIADVICDSSLQEKAIIGRLGLFVKRASQIESGEELTKRPHQLILGKNYEQLIEFACVWSTHKNTKVRQNSLKLIIEVCRVNSIDPRGQPFKQRIINFILGLRPSLRDPLVKKINEVCQVTASEEGGPGTGTPYIDVNELELNLATKTRSVSLDVHNKRRQAAAAQGKSNLPDIGGALPSSNNLPSLSVAQPVLVLPHSEPLSLEQIKKAENLIELFNLELVTCFYSQTWSTRMAAIEKVSEQLYQLDPNRRDAMTAEINRKNFPIEENFRIFLEFIEEGCKDPVLKNFLAILELFQKSLPIFFRYIQPQSIKKELMPLVSNTIKKTTDLKAKVREATINFCLYLSHQSPIGPEVMVTQVLQELETVLDQQSTNVAANLGNSHMIASCLKLLGQFQQQTKILEKAPKTNLALYTRFIGVINSSLKHQNPTVRKEAESLFKILYAEFGEKMDKELVGQKEQVTKKLLQEAKQETGIVQQQQQQDYNIQRAQTHIRTELLNQSSILTTLLPGTKAQECLAALKLPNPKKRLQAIVELKKALQQYTVGITQVKARELFEPLSLLLRQLLADEDSAVYLETLNMLKFVVGALAPHLSTLDLHLMLGSFIGIIVANTVSSHLRTQMASDKVIIFFAKHSNIGPFVVAKDVLKNIEKCLKAIQIIPKREEQQTVLQDKKPTMMRFLSILQLLLQHFSIVLCYQTDFYDKCIELIADTMLVAADDQNIKNLCIQLIVNLQAIDYKLLESSVQKLDVARKTPLRKTMIELEHQQKQGKNVITQDHHAFVAGGITGNISESPAIPLKQTRGSIVSTSRTSLFSPGSTVRGNSPGFGASQNDWSKKSIDVINQQISLNNNNAFKNPDIRAMRRMISLDNDNRNSQTFQSMQSKQFKEDNKELILPEIMPGMSTNYNQKFGAAAQSPMNPALIGGAAAGGKMSMTSTGGAGFNSNANYGPTPRTMRTISDNAQVGGTGVGGGIRPPLYVPGKREPTSGRPGNMSVLSSQLSNSQTQPAAQETTGGYKQFKTEFNSNLYSGLQGVGVFGSVGVSGTAGGSVYSNVQAKKPQPQATTGANSIFKPQAPTLKFETGVKRYEETSNTKPSLGEF